MDWHRTAETYLSGRLRKQALPAIVPGAAPPSSALKRLVLPQGELAQLLDGTEPMRYIAVVELRPGTARGNHFHKKKGEYIYLIAGRADLLGEDVQTKAREKIPLLAGDLVFVGTGIAHRLDVQEAGYAVEFSEAPFDPEDTYRHIIEERFNKEERPLPQV